MTHTIESLGRPASEAKRIYLDSPDAPGDTDDLLRKANAALDVVIALCRVRVT